MKGFSSNPQTLPPPKSVTSKLPLMDAFLTKSNPAPAETATPVSISPVTGAPIYKVQTEDDLSKIASRFKISISDLENINGGAKALTDLRAGQILNLPRTIAATNAPSPFFDPADVVPENPSVFNLKEAVAIPEARRLKTYTIAKGDIPENIAHKLGVEYRELLTLNGIEDPTKLPVGRILEIPPRKSIAVQEASLPSKTQNARDTGEARAGDLKNGGKGIQRLPLKSAGNEPPVIMRPTTAYKPIISPKGTYRVLHISEGGDGSPLPKGQLWLYWAKTVHPIQLLLVYPRGASASFSPDENYLAIHNFHGSGECYLSLLKRMENDTFQPIDTLEIQSAVLDLYTKCGGPKIDFHINVTVKRWAPDSGSALVSIRGDFLGDKQYFREPWICRLDLKRIKLSDMQRLEGSKFDELPSK